MAALGPESARPPHPQLGSPASVQTHNLPPNRGLERALEEAAASGVLSLSCRKLKEFPRTAANHDLTDTVEAASFQTSAAFSEASSFLRSSNLKTGTTAPSHRHRDGKRPRPSSLFSGGSSWDRFLSGKPRIPPR